MKKMDDSVNSGSREEKGEEVKKIWESSSKGPHVSSVDFL